MDTLRYFSSGFLTGYGFTFGIRKEFSDSEFIADTEDVGSIDAPDRISAGGMVAVNGHQCQQASWRN